MQISTNAIVLNSIKYGDSGLIVKCFTEEEGIKSYYLQGILKKKKGKVSKSHFLPLSILKINAKHNNRGALNSIVESKIENPFISLHTEISKQSIVFFLSEFLSLVLNEEDGEHLVLFDFIVNSIRVLDHSDNTANFHLKFILELTKCLGFYPDETEKDSNVYFDLREGRYVSKQGVDIVFGDDLQLFNRVLGIKFEDLNKERFSKNERNKVLELLFRYYQYHLTSFKRPKSLDVLSKVLA